MNSSIHQITVNHRVLQRLLGGFLISFSLLTQANSQGGQTGLPFLKLGVGARSVGMGEAYSAIANDASATYYNPAGLVTENTVDILFMHRDWIQGVRTEFLGVRLPLGNYAVGLGINTTNIGEIQLRTRPGPPEGLFSSHDFALGISLASRIDSSLSVGATAKFLYEKIFVDEASGAAVDFGVLYHSPFEGLNFALVGTNFGSMGSLRSEKIKLPSSIRLGSSFTSDVDFARSILTVGADLIKVFREDKAHLHIGGEMYYLETISFRLGYAFGYESRGATVGLGLEKDFLRLDYGFSPQTQQFNNGHSVSLGVQF